MCLKMAWFQVIKAWNERVLTRYEPDRYRLTLAQSRSLLVTCENQPLISIVTPVYKVDSKWLELCIRSVVGQHYSRWELILVDDGSQQEELTDLMESWCRQDKRVKTVVLEHNQGIAGATNAGYQEASGDFIGILDHDDELSPDALAWVIWALNQNPQAKWFYSDEDLISTQGVCHSPFYKPDYSPENLLSRNYLCHFRVYAKDVLMQIGGKRTGFDGAQDHDLALRYCEAIKPSQVVHIPRVLYHWRTIPSSASSSIKAKPKASVAGVRAVSQALDRRGAAATVTSHPLCPTLYRIEFKPKESPKAAIIISSRHAGLHLDRCLASIDRHTTYSNCHIIVVHDQSEGIDSLVSFKKIQQRIPTAIFKPDKEESYSEKLNQAARQIDAEFFVFMNDSIHITTSNWLKQLTGTMQLDKTIGAVGPMLLNPRGTIRHAGVILGIRQAVGMACRNISGDLPGDNCRAHALQEYSALIGSFFCVSRVAFESVNAFDSARFPDVYSEVDMCLRMKQQGFRSIYNPMVRAVWNPKKRSVNVQSKTALRQLRQDYSNVFLNDPFFNPNLSLDNEWFVGYRDFSVECQIPGVKELGHLLEPNN